jgi:hypothetical protein
MPFIDASPRFCNIAERTRRPLDPRRVYTVLLKWPAGIDDVGLRTKEALHSKRQCGHDDDAFCDEAATSFGQSKGNEPTALPAVVVSLRCGPGTKTGNPIDAK